MTTQDAIPEQKTAVDKTLAALKVDSAAMTEQQNLDIFNFRDEVVGDYRRYIDSFLKIRDPRVHQFVQNELDRGQLWPDPLIQLNPTYKSGINSSAKSPIAPSASSNTPAKKN